MTSIGCDLLCVGGGLGGLAAAVRAHDLGLDVQIVEASSMVGGGATYGGGLTWIPCTHLEQEAGIEDSIESVERYLDAFSKNDDVALRRAWLQAGPEAIRWYCEAGVPFTLAPMPDDEAGGPDGRAEGRFVTMEPIPGATLGEWQQRTRTSPIFPGGATMEEMHRFATQPDELQNLRDSRAAEDWRTFGAGLAAGFVRAALVEREIPIEMETRVVSLLQEGGAVVGAVADSSQGRLEIHAARGVLIATGSYGNTDYAAVFERLPDLVDLSPPLFFGDNLSLADPTPAATLIGEIVSILPGYHFPGETHPGTDEPLYRGTSNLTWEHAILVNRAGQRFGDEMFHGPEVVAHAAVDPLTGEWINYPSYLICDDRFRTGSPPPPLNPGEDWPAEFAARGKTLEELAETVGIDPVGLRATVERFNGFAAEGVDRDFGRGHSMMGRQYGNDSRPNPNLAELTRGPFWAIPIRLAGGGNYSLGVAINGDGQAVSRAGEPVPGLYVTGNSAARMEVMRHHTGTTDSRNITWAFTAASHAAGVPVGAATADRR